jgi:hypothetical protein
MIADRETGHGVGVARWLPVTDRPVYSDGGRRCGDTVHRLILPRLRVLDVGAAVVGQ